LFWFAADYSRIQQRAAMKKQLTEAVAEAKKMEKSKTKPLTLSEQSESKLLEYDAF
jgi:hypothetical protein